MGRPKEILVKDFIPVGREYAVRRSYLMEVTHLADRDIRKQIEMERLNGVPIINVGNGYYVADPEDKEDVVEAMEFISLLGCKITAMTATRGALSQWLSKVAEDVLNG